MAKEISLDPQMEEMGSEEEQGLLGNLEGKIHHLLTKFYELKKERDSLVHCLGGREGTSDPTGKKIKAPLTR